MIVNTFHFLAMNVLCDGLNVVPNSVCFEVFIKTSSFDAVAMVLCWDFRFSGPKIEVM